MASEEMGDLKPCIGYECASEEIGRDDENEAEHHIVLGTEAAEEAAAEEAVAEEDAAQVCEATVILEQAEEVVATTVEDEEDAALLVSSGVAGVQTLAEGDDGSIIAQLMDIREPLSTLRTLLEQRMGFSLRHYNFWLQDTQILESHKNLVDQCVQGEGLVQINVQIKMDNDFFKINIVDVLKPAEDMVEGAEEHPQHHELVSETEPIAATAPQIEEEEPQQVVTPWTMDLDFRREQERLRIPYDPEEWTSTHVKHWIQWAVRQFNLAGVVLADWDMSGAELCRMSTDHVKARVPRDPGDIFTMHLELLKRCKFVAVVQKEPEVQFSSSDAVSPKLQKQFRSKNIKMGIPKLADITPPPPSISLPGNRTGNNGQIQLWQFLLELLTDKEHRSAIQWLGDNGEFKLNSPEMVAQLWGMRKNKPNMNYEKLSRALRYYYDGDMIAKVHGKRFVYRFVCDLKDVVGYSAEELNHLVQECEQKHLQKMRLQQNRLRIFTTTSAHQGHAAVLDSDMINPLTLEAS